AVIFASAFLVRLGYVLITVGTASVLPDSLADQLYYIDIASNLASGAGFALSFPVFLSSPGPTNMQSPLYPAVLAANFALFGGDYFPIRVLQALLVVATAVLCAQIGARLWNVGVGVIAGVGMASYPLAIMLTRPIMTEVPSVFLLALLTLFIVWFS